MRLRHHIIKLLLTEEEKHLLARATQERVEQLRSCLKERWADRDILSEDIKLYEDLGDVFSTETWKS